MSMEELAAANEAETRGFHPALGRAVVAADGFPENALSRSKRRERVFQVTYEFLKIAQADTEHLRPFKTSKCRAADVLGADVQSLHQLFSTDLFGHTCCTDDGKSTYTAEATKALGEVVEYVAETDEATVEEVLEYGDASDGD